MTSSEYEYLMVRHGHDETILNYLEEKLQEYRDQFESIPKATDEQYEKHGVHITHCCNWCRRCKYCDLDCPVANCIIKAEYGCNCNEGY